MPDLLQPKFTQFGPYMGATCENGDWLPTVSFVTPGDLVVAYSAREGYFQRIGSRVFVDFRITTSTFTFTTSAGNLLITGLPFPVATGFPFALCCYALKFTGITLASYTEFYAEPLIGSSNVRFSASGQGQTNALVIATMTPSGGNLQLSASMSYPTP